MMTHQSTTTSLSSTGEEPPTNSVQQAPEWDPLTQIYKDGVVPAHHSMSMSIEELLAMNDGKLRIFGYGSLCWHPGSEGVLSLGNIEEDEHDHEVHNTKPKKKVTTTPGRAIGYQRCWAQRSADHRGTPSFNGIVCTLLSDEEVWELHHKGSHSKQTLRPSMTEGLIYTIDKELVDDCLAELDFREKGGYARDVIDVVEDETGNTVKALLYRGTPENPAFWKRVFMDLTYAAGSNEHNQLLLSPSETDNNSEVNEVHELTEMLLVTLRLQDEADELVSLHAGGGHSALLTKSGAMHTWGWNDAGQLGRLNNPQEDSVSSLANVPPLSIKIAVADLGHTHTLVIEKDTGRLFGFGENGRGQVDGLVNSNAVTTSMHTPTTPSGLIDEQFVEVAAGLFHSAAITVDGDLVTFGCSRFRQSLPPDNDTSSIGRWRPSDGSKLVQVTCGRRHTVMLDDLGRVWTLGLENKYGQLGRSKSLDSPTPQLVDGPLGQPNSGCVVLTSGWSHILALIRKKDGTVLYGWGRNDKGQLGKQNETDFIATPQVIDVPSCIANSFSVQRKTTSAGVGGLCLDPE
ncbi:predicted protein [Thalassiosira pseudonana CCMP1335]|uniref:glutathione-specific gamma-glutamylcyclotransferase n=1 Tax=Thalassiosira pseudonana TaxID=35128 RepID=B8C4L6_THAPS|nr:predicted protein [Thalassiosira pseudonana CCMP1335]EED91746.1 predicted protein [Thalassiosira pseudonana CCMP1335]